MIAHSLAHCSRQQHSLLTLICAGGHSHPEEEGGAPEEDRDGFRYGRDPQGGDQGVQGDPDMPLLQGDLINFGRVLTLNTCYSGETKGRDLDEVLPCLLLRLPANSL